MGTVWRHMPSFIKSLHVHTSMCSPSASETVVWQWSSRYDKMRLTQLKYSNDPHSPTEKRIRVPPASMQVCELHGMIVNVEFWIKVPERLSGGSTAGKAWLIFNFDRHYLHTLIVEGFYCHPNSVQESQSFLF